MNDSPIQPKTGRALLGLTLIGALPLGAATIQVDTTADDLTDNGNCSLREAVVAANSNAPVDDCQGGQSGVTDLIQIPAGSYVLTLGPRGDDASARGDLDVLDDVEIVGAGADLTAIDADRLDRVFEVAGGVEVVLADLTLTGGDPGSGDGGAIENFGQLVVRRVELHGNRADGPGGAIRNNGVVTLEQSALIDNLTNDHGGALDNHGTATLVNCTVSGNDGGNLGGGLYNNDNETMTVRYTTVFGNVASSGAAVRNGGTMTVTGSIVVGTCQGQVSASGGGNVESPGDGCGFGGLDNVSVADAGVGTLALHGGATRTHELEPASPAIDAASTPDCPAFDQRGGLRPLDGDGNGQADCDAGAHELVPGGHIFSDDFETGDLSAWSGSG